MRDRFLVTYDISDDDRRTAVFRALRGFGDHIQYSVFRCDLSERARVTLIATRHPLIEHKEDQILPIDLGSVDGRAASCVTALPHLASDRTVLVL